MGSNNDANSLSVDSLNAAAIKAVDELCDRFEQAWKVETPNLVEYLDQAPPNCRDLLLEELVAIELLYRRDAQGNPVVKESLLQTHAKIAEQLRHIYAQASDESGSNFSAASTARPREGPSDASDVVLVHDRSSRGLHIRCPHCREPVELLADTPSDEVSCKTCGSEFSLVGGDDDATDAPTLQSLGRFELVSRLGVGGFGTVWKARDTELDRVVALKIPRKGNLGPDETEHFFREARAAAQLRHANIVAVYEIGREGETVFIVSDYVPGVTLSDWMSGFRPSVNEIARLAAIVADALHHAHALGVIHRDLKPSNIMIDDHGEPHIMDFGLAKRITGEVTMTRDGQILGTAAYMSPEQAAGDSHWTDCRTDIYSLGVVLFQMATGEFPYRGNHEMHLYRKQIEDAPDPRKLNPHLPQDFATICLKCLERDPNRRYGQASEVADELRRLLRGEPIRARAISQLARAWRWAKRKPALASALLLTLFLSLAGPLVAVVISQKNRSLQQKNRDQIATNVQHQEANQKLTSEKLQLEQQLERIYLRAPGLERNTDYWQKMILRELVDGRLAETENTLGTKTLEPLSRAQLHSALGFLHAELGETEQATKHLTQASSTLELLLSNQPEDRLLQMALAECLAAIAETSSDDALVREAKVELLELRRTLANQNKNRVTALVDLMEARWQTRQQAGEEIKPSEQLRILTEFNQQLLASWPTEPGKIYQAVCRLTMRRPVLAKSTDGEAAE